MSAAAHNDLDHLEDAGLVHAPAALRARPLRDVSQDDRLAVNRHPHLDRARLIGPGAGATAVGRRVSGYHRLLPWPDGCPVFHGPVDQAASGADKDRPTPGNLQLTARPAGARP